MRPEVAPRAPATTSTSCRLPAWSTWHHCTLPGLLLGMVLFAPVAGAAGEDDELARVRAEIEALTAALESDDARLTAARDASFELQRQLAARRRELDELRQRIAARQDTISRLRTHREAVEHDLPAARRLISQSAIARYALLNQPRLKLILNQQQAGKLGRTLAYYDYVTRAYGDDLNIVKARIAGLRDTEQALRLETNTLRQLRSTLEQALDELAPVQASQAELMRAIGARMEQGRLRIEQLQADEQRLGALLSQVRAAAAQQPPPDEPFVSLKGELDWPTPGRVAKAPGSAIRSGGARWAGVLIAGEPGTAVRAIAAGEVVFADWFRNLGQLVIVDHGDGYMTLYGNNAEVLARAGDSVVAGDTIATVGAGGSEMPAGVYFELRERGEPVDPRAWFARRD